jgi:NAD(P)-dependent dehydrogenase (short-subunit alcohol dehydrogenase family)
MTSILDLFRLDGRVAIVTGASRGLGASIAVALAEAGAAVVITARDASRLEATASEIRKAGGRALPVAMDLADQASCAGAVQAAARGLGVVDILVNNAGIATVRPATRETPAEFRNVVEANLLGTYWCSQEFGRSVTRGGSIVSISSNIGSRTGGIPQAAYAASKAGIEALSRDLAAQWGSRKGIRVNTVAPGFFETNMTPALNAVMKEAMTACAPLGRAGTHAEVAAAVLFFASDASSYITGEVLTVDGGLSRAGSMFGAMSLG